MVEEQECYIRARSKYVVLQVHFYKALVDCSLARLAKDKHYIVDFVPEIPKGRTSFGPWTLLLDSVSDICSNLIVIVRQD